MTRRRAAADTGDADGPAGAGWWPLVTVMIDNYNYGRYLRAATDSALEQSYPRVEVLVVDDGSTDESRELIAGYGDRVRSVLLTNGGQAAAVNAGLPHVRGELLLLLDSDDVLDPDTVEWVVAEFRGDPACVRVQYRLRVIDGDGRETGEVMPPARVPLLAGDLRPQLARFRGWRWPTTSGNAWRTSAVRAIPPIPEVSFRQAADRWWADLVSLQGTVRALPTPGGQYRVHSGSFSGGQGRSRDYFTVRVARRQQLHDASVQVARTAGLAYPGRLDGLQDAALSSWQLAARKLGPGTGRAAGGRGLLVELQGVRACLTQPNTRRLSRLAHTGWYLALLATPTSSGAAARLVAWRYGSG